MNDDEFFSATDELKIIRKWARARYAAPWAVFGQVYQRVVATTEPAVQLPGVIGGRASLNTICVYVAPSGGGKGISDKVARLAWPAEITERPIGSGEGIAQLFKPPKPKEGESEKPGITRALINVSEIDTIAGTASRQGSTLLATLKAAAMGELLGQSNAAEATTRVIQPHTYRMCLSIGAQPTHCGVLLDDTSGGTPQRVLWFPTTDPTMPADRTPDPEPLNVALPAWTRAEGVVEIVYGLPEIEETIISSHLARQRGDSDALDGHAVLTRCKVAAGLAILHHRTVVSELDWRLSEAVMEVSNRTRLRVIEESKRAEREKIRGRAVARATGDQFYDDRRTEQVKGRLLRALERRGPSTRRELIAGLGKRELRELFDAAMTQLIDEHTVTTYAVDQAGTGYQLTQPGVSADPGVSTQNPSSEVLTQMVSADPKTPPKSTNEVEMPAPATAPRRCTTCFLDLPAANLTGVCDDCGDGEQIHRPDPAPARELKPVTMSQLERRRLKGLAV